MYVKVTKSAGHAYIQLAESFRDDSGRPRQRVVSTLGRARLGIIQGRRINVLKASDRAPDAVDRSFVYQNGPLRSADQHPVTSLLNDALQVSV